MEVGGNLLYVAGLIGKWVFVLECVCFGVGGVLEGVLEGVSPKNF